MILFYGEGRLGNQLFQYHALASIARPGELILAVGLEDLEGCVCLAGPRVVAVRTTLWVKRGIKYLLLPLILRPLSKVGRLFNYGYEAAEGAPLRLRPGLIQHFSFVDGGYYQCPESWAARFPARLASPQPSGIRDADDFLARTCPRGSQPVFVHVRRGDYIHHAYGKEGSLALPTAYYRQAIELVCRAVSKPFFIFVTDDVAWVDSEFRDIAPRCVSSSDTRFDWTLLTRCKAGVLSNSTFSLSAAMHMDDPRLLVGPRYWLGFRQGQWNPKGIELKDHRQSYIDVAPEVQPESK